MRLFWRGREDEASPLSPAEQTAVSTVPASGRPPGDGMLGAVPFAAAASERRGQWPWALPLSAGFALLVLLIVAVTGHRTGVFWVAVAAGVLLMATLFGSLRRDTRLAVLEAASRVRTEEPGPRREPPAGAVPGTLRRRSYVWGAALVVAVLLGTAGVVVYGHDPDPARGPFPVPPAPPVGSAQTGAAISLGTPLIGGLAIESTDPSGTGADEGPAQVSAVNTRTGVTYWRYPLDGAITAGPTPEAVTGGVVVVSGAGSGDRLTMVDLHMGRERWHRALPADPALAGGMVVMAGSGVVAVIDATGVTGFDARTGRRRWHARWPAGCQVRSFSQAIAGLLLAGRVCGDGSELIGYVPATGKPRWSLASTWLTGDGVNWPGSHLTADGNAIILWTTQTTTAIDAATGALLRIAGSPRGEVDGWIGAGVEVGGCDRRRPGGAPARLCADDPVTGRGLWQYQPPAPAGLADTVSPIVAVAGRVYFLATSGAHAGQDLIVLDARTGHALGQAPMPGAQMALGGTALGVTGDTVVLQGGTSFVALIGGRK